MKKVIIIIFPILLIGQDPNMSENIQNIINQAKDYYDVSLFDDSKSILLKLLHSNEGKPFEAEIRYHLGLACYYSNNAADARIQWKKVISKYPTNVRARELNRVFSNFTETIDSTNFFREEEFEYSTDLGTARLFWTPTYINAKLFWSELKDAKKAVAFYKGLVKKYDDPKKKFQILFYSFLITAGYNSNDYGFKNQNALDYKHNHDVKGLINRMEKLITDEDDPNYGQLVQVYYLWGVKKSGSKLFSGRVKVNKDSKPLFKKVIELTENNPNNIYRIFSEHWLNK